jgi:hypothetical protein
LGHESLIALAADSFRLVFGPNVLVQSSLVGEIDTAVVAPKFPAAVFEQVMTIQASFAFEKLVTFAAAKLGLVFGLEVLIKSLLVGKLLVASATGRNMWILDR